MQEELLQPFQMKAARSFETSGTTHTMTKHHIPDDFNLLQQKCLPWQQMFLFVHAIVVTAVCI
jgi:hypothetical protein